MRSWGMTKETTKNSKRTKNPERTTMKLRALRNFAFQLFIGEKPFNRAPLWYYAAGGGIHGFTTRTSESVYVNGLPSREAIRSLAIPIVLENSLDFSCNLVGTAFNLAAGGAGGTGLRLTCLFDGLYARGVL